MKMDRSAQINRRGFLAAGITTGASVFLLACQQGTSTSATPPISSPPTPATPTAAPAASATPKVSSVVWGTFRERAPEWSDNVGGRSYETRGKGFAVQIERCEGPRVLIHDPSTAGPAYVDRDVLEMPTDFCLGPKHGATDSKSVVVAIAGPLFYHNSRATLDAIANLIERGAGERDRFVVMWLDGTDIIPPLEMPPVAPYRMPATPTPSRNQVDIFARAKAAGLVQRMQADATATPEAVKKILKSQADMLRTIPIERAPAQANLQLALDRARRILAAASGTPWLLLGTRLQPPDTEMLARFPATAIVRFIATDCPDAGQCAKWEDQWVKSGVGANVDVGFWDSSVDLAEKMG